MSAKIHPHVRTVIRALKAADDPVVQVADGECVTSTDTEDQIIKLVEAVDFSTLITQSGRFVNLTPYEAEKDDVVVHSYGVEGDIDLLALSGAIVGALTGNTAQEARA